MHFACQVGPPLEEGADEEDEKEEDEVASSTIPTLIKEPAPAAPSTAIPSFFEINTLSTHPKQKFLNFQTTGGDAKQEPVSPDQKVQEADVIVFESIGNTAVRYWKTQAKRKAPGSSTRPKAAFMDDNM